MAKQCWRRLFKKGLLHACTWTQFLHGIWGGEVWGRLENSASLLPDQLGILVQHSWITWEADEMEKGRNQNPF